MRWISAGATFAGLSPPGGGGLRRLPTERNTAAERYAAERATAAEQCDHQCVRYHDSDLAIRQFLLSADAAARAARRR